ncbi:MAG: FecR domain-containing protein [Saprospiraceae bacterium]|nr:FecR domain-containing protein [Saprospiraceae bacterium]
MSNPERNSNYADLISRYLSGEASDAEVQTLEDWVLADEENKASFVAAKKAWVLAGMRREQSKVDVEGVWQKTQQLLEKDAPVVPLQAKRPRRLWLGIAAGVLILVAVGLGILWNSGGSSWEEVIADQGTRTTELPDGTLISLNQGSRMRYRIPASGERRVQLFGGALFDVKRAVERPFIIEAGPVKVEVLGTSFYVDAREEEPEVQVIVESGEVKVSAADKEQNLRQNDQVAFNKGTAELITIEKVDENYRSLINNDLIFKGTPIDEAVFAMNRHFGTHISVAITDTSNCEIDATFEDQSLDAILLILESTFGIEVNRQGDQIILSGDSCR